MTITTTRLPLALLTSVLLSLGALACGTTRETTTGSTVSTDHRPATSTAVSSPGGYLKHDDDSDYDDTAHDPGNPEKDAVILFAPYGGRASPTTTRAVTALVKRYFTASVAGEAAKACSMLAAGLVEGFLTAQHRSASSRNEQCATSLAPLLAQQHHQLVADEVPTMVVTSVHVKGNVGAVALGFKNAPEGETRVEREGHTWKINALFAGLMP